VRGNSAATFCGTALLGLRGAEELPRHLVEVRQVLVTELLEGAVSKRAAGQLP
jgi:hypothetical protein